MNVVGYTRVSTGAQGESGLGLAAQRFAIEEECRRRGWTLAEVCSDTISTRKDWKTRVGLDRARGMLEDGEVDVLMVAKLDRLVRSLTALCEILDWVRDRKLTLVVLDLGVDTSTPAGQLVTKVLGVIAEYEREMIATRVRESLAMLPPEKRARMANGKGGRHYRKVPEGLASELRASVRGGCSLAEIARRLNAKKYRTQTGEGQWTHTAVGRCLERIGIDPKTYPRLAS